jgi:hypothetical protein
MNCAKIRRVIDTMSTTAPIALISGVMPRRIDREDVDWKRIVRAGHDEILEAEGEGKQESGNYRWHEEWKRNLAEGSQRRCVEIFRGFNQAVVNAGEA